MSSYDADGNMTTQTLPGRLTQKTTFDEGGEPVQLQYLGQVTPVTVSTDPSTGEATYTPGTPVQDQPWLTWSTLDDVTGRARFEATGTGAAFDGGNGVATIDAVTDWTAGAVGQAASYGREYRYDGAGRLTHVTDDATTLDATTGQPVPTCTERDYTFDANGRRTHLATLTHDGGDCAATGTTTTVATTGYDTADRPTTGKDGVGTYAYDLLGRQTTLPAADAPLQGAGDVTLGYFDDDLPRSITQNGTTTTFTLDAAARRSVQTTTTSSGTTATTTRRYTDSGDNPAWTEVTTSAGTTTTRYAQSIGGDLSASIDDTTGNATRGDTTLSLANPHGDIVTTVTIPATHTSTTSATQIGGWASYDEYGNTTTADTVNGPLGYGWLGAKQRSTTTATAGLTLMGVRLYNATRGLFTAPDPVPGGNDNTYNYPNDPVNKLDLNGMWSVWGALAAVAVVASVAAMFTPVGWVAALAWGASAILVAHDGYGCARARSWRGCSDFAVDVATLGVGKGAGHLFGKYLMRKAARAAHSIGRQYPKGVRHMGHAYRGARKAAAHAARAGERRLQRSAHRVVKGYAAATAGFGAWQSYRNRGMW
jgi:RHS repeat-associated protein